MTHNYGYGWFVQFQSNDYNHVLLTYPLIKCGPRSGYRHVSATVRLFKSAATQLAYVPHQASRCLTASHKKSWVWVCIDWVWVLFVLMQC